MRRSEVRRSLGVYRRQVMVRLGLVVTILVPRFECRGQGSRRSQARTFSVLPVSVLPRRRWSVQVMLQVALLCEEHVVAALDRLAEAGLAVEANQILRVFEVLGQILHRLREHPVEGVVAPVCTNARAGAVELARLLCSDRGPPAEIAMAWQARWGRPLYDVKLR